MVRDRGRGRAHESDHRHCGLLRSRRERPRSRAAEKANELTPPHGLRPQGRGPHPSISSGERRGCALQKNEPPMSQTGQKPALPRRSIDVRFAPNKQTPTERVQCDVMVESRMGAEAWAMRQRSVSHARSSNRITYSLNAEERRYPSDPIVGTSRPRSRNKFLISQLVSAMSRQPWHAAPCVARLPRQRFHR